MSFLKNTVSLLALFSVVPAAYAVTARPSVLNTGAARRMPTMTAYINGATGGTVTDGSNTTSSSLLANAECIDAYTSCIKVRTRVIRILGNVQIKSCSMPRCLSVCLCWRSVRRRV